MIRRLPLQRISTIVCRRAITYRTAVKAPPANDGPAAAASTDPLPAAPTTPFPSILQASETSGSDNEESIVDWSKSFYGLSTIPFSADIATILQTPPDAIDVEIKPDGIIYLPEIKYRRILNKAFGPGGWGLAPRGDTSITETLVSREYALVCHGRLVSVARGEQTFFDPSGIATATEGCKSNALMRCCKDLGVASDLWDPRFIRDFKGTHCVEVFAEHVVSKKKRKLWRRKDAKLSYPYKE